MLIARLVKDKTTNIFCINTIFFFSLSVTIEMILMFLSSLNLYQYIHNYDDIMTIRRYFWSLFELSHFDLINLKQFILCTLE